MSQKMDNFFEELRGPKATVAFSMLVTIILGIINAVLSWDSPQPNAIFQLSIGVYLSWGTQCFVSCFVSKKNRKVELSLVVLGIIWLIVCSVMNHYGSMIIIVESSLIAILFQLLSVQVTEETNKESEPYS